MNEPAGVPAQRSQEPSTTETDDYRSLVEDVLLLLFQPDSNSIAGENTLYYVLGGALLADLALEQRVELRPASGAGGRIHALGSAAPDDEFQRSMWSYVNTKPRRAQAVLAAIGPTLREPVLDRLVESGDLVRRRAKALGFIPTTTYSLGNERRSRLLAGVRAALVDGAVPDSRAALLGALLSASGTLPQFHREIPWNGDVYLRGKKLERGDWGAAAASAAVTRTMVAMIAGSVATTIVIAHKD
jgi:hypothetical protein